MKEKLVKVISLMVAIVLIAVALLYSCTPKTITSTPEATSTVPSATTPETPTIIPKYGGTLRIISDPIPPTVGWAADPMGAPQGVSQNCLETLLRGDNKGGVVPWLAESYQVADDLKSITFNLRRGIKFHDGSDFNAEVAKWNLDNYIVSKVKPYWSSVDVIDNDTVRVNFTEWTNTLPGSFADAFNTAFMVSKLAFDKNGIEWMRANPVGTGPFKFDSFNIDVNFKALKNNDYWQKDAQGNPLPYLDGIEFIFIVDPNTQKMAMQAGDGDVNLCLKTAQDIANYSAIGSNVEYDINAVSYLIPDTANEDSPWAKQKVREAVEYAIDRESIAKAFGYGYLEAAYQIPPRSSEAYNPNFSLGRKYDLDKAKQLMKEAGYPDGFNTTLIMSPTGQKREIGPVIQADLSKLGIQASIDYPEIFLFINYLGPGTWPTNSVLHQAVPSVGISYLGVLQSTLTMIGQSWLRTPELMQVYQAAITSPVPDINSVRAVTDLITNDALLIPIVEGITGYAKAPYVVVSFKERGTLREWEAGLTWLNK